MKLCLWILVLYCAKVAQGLSCWQCDNAKSEEECHRTGRMKLCALSETMCQIQLRRGGWGPELMIEKSCKRPSACIDNFAQNIHSAWSFGGRQIQCNNKAPSSVCRCCCSGENCNYNILKCERGGKCPELSRPANGWMRCTNGFSPFSTCTFGCRKEFALVGSRTLKCDVYGKWGAPPPRCVRITCPPGMKTPRFGWQRCTNGIQLRSVCRFGCEEGYRLHGASSLQCINNRDGDQFGVWSRVQPVCKPLQCKELHINHGRYQCSDRNNVGSRCTLNCNVGGGYEQYPKTFKEARCQRTEKWTEVGCCGLPCPPFAIMDFILVLDSSSSVGKVNWDKMKKFARGFLDDFVVRDDSTRFSVIRYNDKVDTDTQILLNDYPNSTEAVLEAFDKIPYDGSGTHTGQALNYTADVLLRTGDRSIARNVVLLITDGASQDEVVYSSKRVRDEALFYVLPVQPPRGKLNMEQVYEMAGKKENVLTDALVGGFDALDEEFSNKVTKLLCGNPCKNPFHDHD